VAFSINSHGLDKGQQEVSGPILSEAFDRTWILLNPSVKQLVGLIPTAKREASSHTVKTRDGSTAPVGVFIGSFGTSNSTVGGMLRISHLKGIVSYAGVVVVDQPKSPATGLLLLK
jgi:hypothetical protein